MKLRSKLIPLTGIAAIAATATPLSLTSCGSKITMVDLTNGYHPKTQASVEKALGTHAANKVYTDDIKKNPDIFKEDLYYGFYSYLTYYLSQMESMNMRYRINSWKMGASNPTFDMVNISYPGEPDVQYPCISFTVNSDLDISLEQYQVNYSNNHTHLTMSVDFKNVPFYAYGYQGAWWAGIYKGIDDGYPYVFNQSAWSINFSYDLNGTIKRVDSTGRTVEATNSRSDSRVLDTYTKIAKWEEDLQKGSSGAILNSFANQLIYYLVAFQYPSYYLSGVYQLPELNPYMDSDGEVYQMTAKPGTSGYSTTSNIQVSGLADNTGTAEKWASEEYGYMLKNIQLKESEDIYLEQFNLPASQTTPYFIKIDKNQIMDPTFIAGTLVDIEGKTVNPSTLAAGEYHFTCPKYITVQFNMNDNPYFIESWTQNAYTDTDDLILTIN